MNAYELADEIQDAYCEGRKLTDVANMLRQLQAENETLNRKLTAYKQSNHVADTQIKALQNLVNEQDKKILDLAFKLVYAERGNEVAKELSK